MNNYDAWGVKHNEMAGEFQVICAMPQYLNFSLEELRWQATHKQDTSETDGKLQIHRVYLPF